MALPRGHTAGISSTHEEQLKRAPRYFNSEPV